MVRLMDSVTRLCGDACAISHTDQDRQHLPLCLFRVTHDGTDDGKVGPTPRPDANGTMWPRYCGQRNITSGEIARHLKKSSRFATQFSSCTTWAQLSSRIKTWKKSGVSNLCVHVIFTPLLPQATEIYKATGLIRLFNLKQRPWNEEEYLVRGPIDSSAIILSFSGEGEEILLELPLFEFQYPFSVVQRSKVLVPMPEGIFCNHHPTPQDRVRIRTAGISCDYFLAKGKKDGKSRVLLDTFTRGRFFTVADYEAARSSWQLSR
ncbi:uncharacterized protein BO66DRAFT_178880 [Aspergillus aculeatinus CBS 121060]|uniref:Uncharacterized protein n=1 Tax=Aspergillus aculeatinus CBS 121060 TaxID=1448322 RepID=A0ACD1HKR0_9EURO|nr:hypothetical protein BO66DRAFT_178880 [Aspergillus aculeatinus CBS 121060]RAH74029.1 hypothetical protein BO66DRAFT_178880 [Aspergillus aculeatinus CBS 121060]